MTAANNLACPKCGYDLRGLTEPRCPECGQELAITTPRGEAALGFVACRIVAILLALRAIVPSIGALVMLADGLLWQKLPPGEAAGGLMIHLLEVALTLLPAALLWFGAGPIASRMLRHASSPTSMGFDAALLTDLAFKVVGVLVIVDAVPWTSHLIGISLSEQGTHLRGSLSDYTPELLGSAVKVALGLWLVLGTRGILNVIDRIRSAGAEKPSA